MRGAQSPANRLVDLFSVRTVYVHIYWKGTTKYARDEEVAVRLGRDTAVSPSVLIRSVMKLKLTNRQH